MPQMILIAVNVSNFVFLCGIITSEFETLAISSIERVDITGVWWNIKLEIATCLREASRWLS